MRNTVEKIAGLFVVVASIAPAFYAISQLTNGVA